MSDTHHTLLTGPAENDDLLILAHGSGGPMDHPFFETLAAMLTKRDIKLLRFEFPYMAERRISGKKAPPNRAPILLECYRDIITEHRPAGRLFIGGKSMGGRMATMIADEMNVDGVICLGYPFHPPGKPEKLRTEHLYDMKVSTLIIQGERDTFGNAEEIPGYNLPDHFQICWSPDGDHSLKPRKKSGHTEEGNIEMAADEIATFMR